MDCQGALQAMPCNCNRARLEARHRKAISPCWRCGGARIIEMKGNPNLRTVSASAAPLLVKQLLAASSVNAATQHIVYQGTFRCTYREFQGRVARLASALSRMGVKAGDVVAVADWDSHRFLECFFAIPMLGAVLQSINIRMSQEQIRYALDHSGASVLIAHHDFDPLLGEIVQTIPQVISIWEGAGKSATRAEYETLLDSGDPNFEFSEFDENSLAAILYTSGTTGVPKGVCVTHRDIVLHTLALAAALGTGSANQSFNRHDVYMPITPMFHAHAWGLPYVATLIGSKQVYPGRHTPSSLVLLIQQEHVTFSHCAPTALHMLLQAADNDGGEIRGLKMIIGGSRMSEGLAAAALARGIEVFTAYGMSEAGPVLTIAQIKANAVMCATGDDIAVRCKAGLPIPLVEIRTVDGDLRNADRGEVVVRSPWLTQGYLKNPSATEELWAGGSLHTGDIGELDGEGYLQITDRIKDVIKCGGDGVSSLEIENSVSRHPAVAEVAVVGVSDPKWGERPLAVVVPKQGCTLRAGDLKTFLGQSDQRKSASPYISLLQVVVVDHIEKSSVGKFDKKELRKKYGR